MIARDEPIVKPYPDVPYGQPQQGDPCQMHYEHVDAGAVSAGEGLSLEDSLVLLQEKVGGSVLNDPEQQTTWDTEVSFRLEEAEQLISDVPVADGVLCPAHLTVPGRLVARPSDSQYEYHAEARYTGGFVTVRLPHAVLAEFSQAAPCADPEVHAYAFIEWHPVPDARGAMVVEARCPAPKKPLEQSTFRF